MVVETEARLTRDIDGGGALAGYVYSLRAGTASTSPHESAQRLSRAARDKYDVLVYKREARCR